MEKKTYSPEEEQLRKERRKNFRRELSWGLANFTQLGISITLPLVTFIYGAIWLRERFSLGSWILILGIVLGLGTSADCAVKFYGQVMKRMKKTKNEPKDGEER